MDTEKVVKRTKTILFAALISGAVLLAAGILFELAKVRLLPENKALVGLSFIPFSIAFSALILLLKIKKSPETMKKFVISETDERLVALKNEAEAKAFKILQSALYLTYMGYTLIVPADVFESAGWWILTGLLLLSLLLQAVLLTKVMDPRSPQGSEL